MRFLKNPIVILTAVLIISILFRGYNLGKVPASLNWDEVSLGYNAYSIFQTGKDEYGQFLPVVLRSYDDYKPALYAYFAIPFVATLGLTEVAVRLPSAIAGVLAVLLSYFLVKEILGKKKITILGKEVQSYYIALLSAFFLAISPWHIQFSRISFESNVGLTINLAAFLLFLKGLKKPYLLILSFGVAALNIHMYQSERVFTPLLMAALLLIYYKKLLTMKKWVVFSIITAIIVAFPLIYNVATDSNALMRAKGVSVFTQQTLVERSAVKLLENEKTGNIIGMLFDNRRVDFVKATIGGYISHFDLNWLFITGDIARHHAPRMGLLYIFQLPLLLAGIYFLIFLPISKKNKIAFFSYFLLVPVPASITSGVPHAVRTLNFAWTWEFMIAIGAVAVGIYLYSQKEYYRKLVAGGIAIFFGVLIFINISYYINQYFVQLNYYTASDWLYGYKQAIEYVEPMQDQYDKIVVENEVPFDQSYMFFLFYLNIDPSYYQNNGGTESGGFRQAHKGFGKFEFKPVKGIEDKGKILMIGRPGDIPVTAKNRKVIHFPNGSEAIAIGEK